MFGEFTREVTLQTGRQRGSRNRRQRRQRQRHREESQRQRDRETHRELGGGNEEKIVKNGCMQVTSTYPCPHCNLTKCSLHWVNISWLILFPDDRHWKHQKLILLLKEPFQVFIWCGVVHGPWCIHTSGNLRICFFGAFQPILAESGSIIGFPGSSLHVCLNDKIPDKQNRERGNGLK